MARMPRMSSTTPTPTSSSTAAKMAGTYERPSSAGESSVGEAMTTNAMAAAKPTAMATPPRRGIGTWWTLRSLRLVEPPVPIGDAANQRRDDQRHDAGDREGDGDQHRRGS